MKNGVFNFHPEVRGLETPQAFAGQQHHPHGPRRHALSLASREVIADSVEYMINAHKADAMICISNRDKDDLGAKPLEQFLTEIKEEIRIRSL